MTEYLAKVRETIVAVHGLTMMHSAHNLVTMMIIIMVMMMVMMMVTIIMAMMMQLTEVTPDEANERAECVENISVISTRLKDFKVKFSR